MTDEWTKIAFPEPNYALQFVVGMVLAIVLPIVLVVLTVWR